MRRSRTRGLRAVAIGLVVAGAVLAAAGAGNPGPVTIQDLYFAPAPGWTQVSGGSSAIAANVPIHDPPGVAHADATVRDLLATGVVITASFYAPTYAGSASFPERSLPLSLTDADVRHSFEGQPNPEVPEYVLWQRVNGFVLDVRVFFGSQEPTARALAEAQAELERLAVP
jgi:hypothetical protein